MSQSDDEEERKTLQKKQKRQEDTAMKGSIDLQQAIELLMKQQQQNQRQKEKSISPKSNLRLPISPKHEQKFDQQEYQKWPKKEPQSQQK